MSFDGASWKQRQWEKVYPVVLEEMERQASLTAEDARRRAPQRKQSGERRRRAIPLERNRTYDFGPRSQVLGGEIYRAAKRAGVELTLSSLLRQAKYGKPLQVIVRRRKPWPAAPPARRSTAPIVAKFGALLSGPKPRSIGMSADRTADGSLSHTNRFTQTKVPTKAAHTGREDIRFAKAKAEVKAFESEKGGALKRSIDYERRARGKTQVVFQVFAAIDYARYVEFPTSRTAAQPFLLPALKATERRLGPALRKRLKPNG